ncbi:hypothetical protein [Bacillus sp. S3]|nr:hypothetical protein [Bacillus sp. S3]
MRDKFLELTLVGGMAENFDLLTGKGLVDNLLYMDIECIFAAVG